MKQVDFLSGVAGLTTKDLARRAIEMEVPDIGHLRVIHPIDVLDSRIQNLHLLPVFLLYGIDPLQAIPLEDFRTTPALHKARWPQISAEINGKRESLRKTVSPRRTPSSPRPAG